MERSSMGARWEALEAVRRIFIAIAMVGMGIQQWMFKGVLAGLELVPEGLPGHTMWAYLTGAALIAAGVSIGAGKGARLASMGLANLFFLSVLVRRMPSIASIVKDIAERTVVFETLAIGGGLLMVAALLPAGERASARWTTASRTAMKVGRILFAISMVIFGWSHLEIPKFIASLIPSWMPWHLFLAYFTAFGFIAAGVAFAANRLVRPAAGLLGVMFLVWVVTLHGPRVAVAFHNKEEWNSAFVALAMSGFSFVLAGAPGAVREESSAGEPAAGKGLRLVSYSAGEADQVFGDRRRATKAGRIESEKGDCA